jgi:hypothetical protein
MHTVTDAFNAACSAPGREITSKVNFNGTTDLPASEIQEIVVTEQFGSSDGVTIGAAFSSSCKVTFYKQDNLPLNGAYFIPSAGIMVGGEAQYVQKGKFYIPSDGVEDSGKLWVTVTGYDRMAGLTEDYMPTITFPATPTQVLADVCKQAGVTPPAVTMPSIQIAAPYTGTLREQLGWLAGLIGCNAKFDATGNLVFCWYADGDLTIDRDTQYMDGLTLTTDDAFTIHSLLTGTDSNPISVGAGKGITTINPYMTAEVAETVFAEIDGKTMRPCTVKWRGNPAVEAGDIVSVIGGSGENLTTYVMELKTQIKGGMSADLTCYGPSDTDYATPSPSEQKFKRMYDDVVKSFQDATQKIIGAQGGYFEITYNKDGYPTGWTLRNTPTVEDNTKMWIMSTGGLGFSTDGGKTISKVALTMDGTINGAALAIGSVSQDAVSGLSQKLIAIDGKFESTISKTEAQKTYATKTDLENIELTPGPPGPAGADGKDGTNGTNGLSVWITYHDGTATPAAPTGDGTKNGWHTNLTDAVVWLSQKVAASASSGTWGTPVRIVGADGKPGTKGDDGVSVTHTDVEYYLSTSETEISGGTWQSTAPAITDGKYLWGRTKITYSNGQTAYTGAYCISKAMADSAKPQIDQVVQTTRQQITDVQQNVNSIILSALENYVKTGDFGSYKEEVSSQLSLLSNQLTLKFDKATADITKVNGDLQGKYESITKSFNFDIENGLVIGETGNPVYLQLNNDILQFVRNNTPELWITADGVVTNRINTDALVIGNVIFQKDDVGDVTIY